ncbi:hypothetical protein pb186bvf_011354 [Paramecium bursaria]
MFKIGKRFLSNQFSFQNYKFIYRFSKELQIKQSETTGNGFYQQQIFTGCLAEYAYYIESNKEALIIDPLRDIQPYLDILQEKGSKLKYILLTHFHADFVSGHIPLQRATGAQIIMGPNAFAPYVNQILKDHQSIDLGSVKIQALHTPGHTLESTCYLLLDQLNNKHSIYTGDTLFLGEVGRPDLAVKSDLTQEDLAALLYDSLKRQILPLPNDTIIYPGHGAGSACGKNISKGSSCTVGTQKQNNYALQLMSKEEFVKVVASDLPTPPSYFFYNVGLNKQNNLEDVNKVIKASLIKLDPKTIKNDVIILDTRNSISDGFIKGSININLKIPFASWVGTLLPYDKDIVLISDKGTEEQAILRLSRIGYDRVIGYTHFEDWVSQPKVKPVEYEKQEFLNKSKNTQLIDIRTKEEWSRGTLEQAQLITLSELSKNLSKIDKTKDLSIYCGTGQRAKIAATLLAAQGYDKVSYCRVGYDELVKI